MHLLYNIAIFFYTTALRLAAPFFSKARLMVNGWGKTWQAAPLEGSVVWFHVSSLGEFEQARPVIEALKASHPEYKIWLTFFSPSGYEVRHNYPLADRVTYLPMDSPLNARHLVSLINPSLVFFVKYDFWFNILGELDNRKVPTYIFSSIFRPSQYFFKPWGGWFLRRLGSFNHIFVQNDESLSLLKSHAISQCSKAGDTRFDRVWSIVNNAEGVPAVSDFLQGRKCVVCGSTWPPDEENLARFLATADNEFCMVIAPHEVHESHILKIEQMFGKSTCVRLSSIGEHCVFSDCRVLIVDSIGLLSRIYRYGSVAYIGGGFGKGIHNTLEAIAYGLPVAFGPNYTKFQEAKDIIAVNGGISYCDYDTLHSWLTLMLRDPDSRNSSAEACRKYVESNLGSTSQILKTIGL